MKKIVQSILVTGILYTPVLGAATATKIKVFQDKNDVSKIYYQTRSKSGLGIKVRLRNFTKRDKRKLYKGVEILDKVINSPQFKASLLAHIFKGEASFNENNGMTNLEIYNHLMTGAEELQPIKDREMDFDLSLYRSWNPFSKVKGYTKPDTMRIWLHKKYYRRSSWTPTDVAANMAHEWVHKMGFGHAYKNNENRPYTVPYGIGGIVQKVAKSMGYK